MPMPGIVLRKQATSPPGEGKMDLVSDLLISQDKGNTGKHWGPKFMRVLPERPERGTGGVCELHCPPEGWTSVHAPAGRLRWLYQTASADGGRTWKAASINTKEP